MKFTKRITTMLLIFVFAFSSLCTVGTLSVSADFSDVSEDYVYSEAITSLVDEGIINGYEDGTFKPENTITRAEFSKLLAVASAPTGYVFSATTTNFPDIADMNAAHGWAIPYIAYAVSTKAINGYTDGTFQAGNPVTYGEAIKMIVCTLGYGPVADTTLTPWYKGYLDIANQIGLTKKAVAVGENPANRGIVAQLIYNMLDCPQLVQTGTDINGNPIYDNSGSGNSFGDSKDNAQSDEGVVMGVTDYSLNAMAVGRNRVQINNEIFALADNLSIDTVKSYIGYRVSYSYSGTGSKKELTKLSRLSGYNSEITVEPWQIVDVTDGYIEYYENEAAENKGEETKISYNGCYIIYNGIPVNPAEIGSGFDISTYFNVETGSIRLFSNDGNDNNAEVVFVESYETFFVNSPSLNNGISTIYDKNPTYTGLSSLTIDEGDIASITKVSSKGGKPVESSLGAITNKSVVSVAVPYGTTEGTTVIISSAYVTGDVTELGSDYENIVIGSGSYELSPYYQKLLDNGCPDAGFDLRDNAKFYLDFLGRIVYTEKNETSDPYGLLVAYATGSSMDSENALRIMTTAGKYLEYNMKSKINVDGTSMSSDDAIDYLKTTAAVQEGNYVIQPVKYRTSGSLFTAIETLDPASPEASLTYSKVGPAFKQGSTTKFSMTTSGSKATIVFVVPSDITKSDKYKKTSASYFSDLATYAVTPYEMEGSAARIVLCQLAANQVVGAQIGASTPVYLVESVTDTSSNGQVVKKLLYKTLATKDSEVKEAVSSDEAEVLAKFESIQSGDVVKFVIEEGVVTDIVKVYSNGVLTSVSPVGTVVGGNPNHVALSGNSIQNYFQAMVCTINEVDDEGTRMTVIPELYSSSPLDETKLITLNRSTNDVPVYVYETSGAGSGFVSSSTGAIKKYVDFKDTEPTNATQALVIVVNEKVVGIYILNN